MPSPEYERGPSPNRPLNAPDKRPKAGPLLMTIGLLILLAVVFLILFTLH